MVRRDSGLIRGEDIIDPLITTLPVALARGRIELDDQNSGFQEVDIQVVYRTGLRLGQIIQVNENLFGQTWYGKITGLTHTYSNGEAITTIRLKKPTDFFV